MAAEYTSDACLLLGSNTKKANRGCESLLIAERCQAPYPLRGGPAFLVFSNLFYFSSVVSELGAASLERGPVEALLRRKAETDRVCEGISEGCRSAEPERVARGGGKQLSSDIPPFPSPPHPIAAQPVPLAPPE